MAAVILWHRPKTSRVTTNLTSRLRPGSSRRRTSARLLRSPPGGASWAGRTGWTLGQGPGRGGQRGGQRLGWGTLVGDQRRRSKSKGSQKEEEEVWGRGWTEWVWPLLTVRPGRGGGETMRGQERRTTGAGAGRKQGRRSNEKAERTDEMSREGTKKTWKRQEGREGGRREVKKITEENAAQQPTIHQPATSTTEKTVKR